MLFFQPTRYFFLGAVLFPAAAVLEETSKMATISQSTSSWATTSVGFAVFEDGEGGKGVDVERKDEVAGEGEGEVGRRRGELNEGEGDDVGE